MSKKALGKGIGALLGAVKNESTDEGSLEVDIDLVKPNPNQPRKTFPEETLEELSQSVRQKGVIQPILVERNVDLSYTIIAGERRFRAAKRVGLKTIPIRVKKLDEIEKLEISLIENIQREDLTPIEEAAAYDALIKFSKISQDDLARHLGKNRVTIANSLRLLKLPDSIKEALNNRVISAGHARAILSAGRTQDQMILFNSIVSKGLSVREAENLAASFSGSKKQEKDKSGSAKAAKALAPELDEIKQKLIDLLGTKVTIKGTLSSGSIEINYFSKEDLERLYEIFFA